MQEPNEYGARTQTSPKDENCATHDSLDPNGTIVTPIYRKLSGPRQSLADIADILEHHIGDGENPVLCKEALDALRRVRNDRQNHYLRAVLRALDDASAPCELLRKIIDTLRQWRYFSGA